MPATAALTTTRHQPNLGTQHSCAVLGGKTHWRPTTTSHGCCAAQTLLHLLVLRAAPGVSGCQCRHLMSTSSHLPPAACNSTAQHVSPPSCRAAFACHHPVHALLVILHSGPFDATTHNKKDPCAMALLAGACPPDTRAAAASTQTFCPNLKLEGRQVIWPQLTATLTGPWPHLVRCTSSSSPPPPWLVLR